MFFFEAEITFNLTLVCLHKKLETVEHQSILSRLLKDSIGKNPKNCQYQSLAAAR